MYELFSVWANSKGLHLLFFSPPSASVRKYFSVTEKISLRYNGIFMRPVSGISSAKRAVQSGPGLGTRRCGRTLLF